MAYVLPSLHVSTKMRHPEGRTVPRIAQFALAPVPTSAQPGRSLAELFPVRPHSNGAPSWACTLACQQRISSESQKMSTFSARPTAMLLHAGKSQRRNVDNVFQICAKHSEAVSLRVSETSVGKALPPRYCRRCCGRGESGFAASHSLDQRRQSGHAMEVDLLRAQLHPHDPSHAVTWAWRPNWLQLGGDGIEAPRLKASPLFTCVLG